MSLKNQRYWRTKSFVSQQWGSNDPLHRRPATRHPDRCAAHGLLCGLVQFMTAKNPVSPEHAAKFAGHVATWCEVLSLGDWRVNVSDGRSNRKVMAEVFKTDLEQRSAAIRLGKDWGAQEVSDLELNKTALHEVLHIFLFELITAAQTKDIDPDTLSSHEHRIINVLERLLVDIE